MPAAPDDDLFQPTLTEADDAEGFNKPWNPWSLVVLAFFFGLPGGGGLLAFNYERLGIRGRLLPTLALVLVVSAAIAAAQLWLRANPVGGLQGRPARRAAGLAAQGAAALAAMALAGTQRRRYRLYQATGQEPGRVLLP